MTDYYRDLTRKSVDFVYIKWVLFSLSEYAEIDVGTDPTVHLTSYTALQIQLHGFKGRFVAKSYGEEGERTRRKRCLGEGSGDAGWIGEIRGGDLVMPVFALVASCHCQRKHSQLVLCLTICRKNVSFNSRVNGDTLYKNYWYWFIFVRIIWTYHM